MTKEEYMKRATEERRQAKAEKRKASAKVVTIAEYVNKYFGELPETTKTFTIEVKNRHFGVWALRMPTEDFRLWLLAGNAKKATLSKSEGMKRYAEAGKPCIKFEQISFDEAKKMRDLFGYELKCVFNKTHAEMKKTSIAYGLDNVGYYFQHLVTLAWGEKDIGETDGKSHMNHADTENINGDQSECKCYDGFLCCQMVNEYWRIEG